MPVRLNGSSSGFVELAAPAVAGSTTLELPTDSIKPGLVLLAQESFSAVSSVSVDSVFSAEYDNYKVVFRGNASTTLGLRIRFRAAGTDAAGATEYREQRMYLYGSATVNGTYNTSSFIGLNSLFASSYGAVALDISGPFLAQTTSVMGLASSDTWAGYIGSVNGTGSSFDGITFLSSSGTFTGSLSIYGYRKVL